MSSAGKKHSAVRRGLESFPALMTSSRVIAALTGTPRDAGGNRRHQAHWPQKSFVGIVSLLLLLQMADAISAHSASVLTDTARLYCNGECVGESTPPTTNRTRALNCRGGNMSDVIECQFPMDSTSIDLSDRWIANQLDCESVRILASLRHLRNLRLDHCNIEVIAALAFSATVSATNAVAVATTTERTDRFPALETLRLSDNRISTIGSRAFDGLVNLIELHLDGNRLVALPDDLFGGSEVRRRIPIMRHLRVLRLERNRLVELGSVAPALVGTAISELRLDENHFRHLTADSRWSSLADNLRIVTIRGNRRPEGLRVDGAVFSGFRLTRLDLSDSSLVVDAAAAVAFLRNVDVETLDLAGNSAIASLVASDGTQPSTNGTADDTDMASSSLRVLHQGIRAISLRRVGLVAVGLHSFAGMSRVTAIDLSSNNISNIDGAAFAPVSKLRLLSVAHNRFIRLGDDWGRHLTELEELIVADNQLTALDARTFDGMVRLRRLDAAGNRLRVVDSELLPVFDSIISRGDAIGDDAVRLRLSIGKLQTSAAAVDLSRNPFHCNCELECLRDWLRHQRRRTIDKSRLDGATPASTLPVNSGYLCSTPDAIAGAQLIDAELVCRRPEIIDLSVTRMMPPNVTTSTVSNDGGSPVVRRVSPSYVVSAAPSFSRPVFRIMCSAEGDPAPSVELQSPSGDTLSVIRSSADDHSGALPKLRTTATWKVHVAVGAHHDNRNQSDRFRYTCTATNAAGRAMRSARVGSHDVEKTQVSTLTIAHTSPVDNFVTLGHSSANGSSSSIATISESRSDALAGDLTNNKTSISLPTTSFGQLQSTTATLVNPLPTVTSKIAGNPGVSNSRVLSSTKTAAMRSAATTSPSTARSVLVLTRSLLMNHQDDDIHSPLIERWVDQRSTSMTVVSSVNDASVVAADRRLAGRNISLSAPSTTPNRFLLPWSTSLHQRHQLSTGLKTTPTANARSETTARSMLPSPLVSSTLKLPTETTVTAVPESGDVSHRRSFAHVRVEKNDEVDEFVSQERFRSSNAILSSAVELLSTAVPLSGFRHSKPEADHQVLTLDAPPSNSFAPLLIGGAAFDTTKNASMTDADSVSQSYVADDDERLSDTDSMTGVSVTDVVTAHIATRDHSGLRPSDDGLNLVEGNHRSRVAADATAAVDDDTFAAGAYQVFDVLTGSPSPGREVLTRRYWPAVAVLTVGGIAAIGALVVWRLRICCPRRRLTFDDCAFVLKPPTNQVACA